MSFTPADLEQLRRMVREEARDAAREEAGKATAPLARRQANISGAYRELAPKVEGARESAHDMEDWKDGFEPHVLGRLKRLEERAEGTERAAVAGAEAAIAGKKEVILVGGKQDALQFTANRADINSAKAVKGNTLLAILVIVVQAIATGAVIGVIKACQ